MDGISIMKTKLRNLFLVSLSLFIISCGGGAGAGDETGVAAQDTVSNVPAGNDPVQENPQQPPAQEPPVQDPPAQDPPVQISIPGTVSGYVDSSLIRRTGKNQVYIFNGKVVPDDIDGNNVEPIAMLNVQQLSGSCNWIYSSAKLTPGTYTVAFTNQAENDRPGVSDTLNFIQADQITIKESVKTEKTFVANNIIRVGPGRTYQTLSAASKAVSSGSTILIDAGIYDDDIAVWRQNNITLRAVDGIAHLRATNVIQYTPGNDQENGMGIWVFKGSNITVENIKFTDARVPVSAGANGAGIRIEGSNISICNCSFKNNENGIMGVGNNLLIEYSEFNNNGLGEKGRTHNIYVVNGSKFTFRYSYSHHAFAGHNLKSRAAENHILYSRLMDEATGQSSYIIDIPDGGKTYIIGNMIQQGPIEGNNTIISYGAESLKNSSSELYLVNNTIVNDRARGTFVYINSKVTTSKLINNIFMGNGNIKSGAAEIRGNLNTTNGSILVDRLAYDYHLAASTTDAINKGVDPGTGSGQSLTPMYEYKHPQSRADRATDSNIDIGAFEYK